MDGSIFGSHQVEEGISGQEIETEACSEAEVDGIRALILHEGVGRPIEPLQLLGLESLLDGPLHDLTVT